MENQVGRLLARAVQQVLPVEANYTKPRSYGVYRIRGSSSVTRSVRFGNHPVRERELTREYGSTEVVAIFWQRQQAKELADLLNTC